MHIVVAPNSFKNALDAEAAAAAISRGLIKSRLHCTTELFPVGDGGDGTGALLIRKLNASVITTEVTDPFGRDLSAEIGITDSGDTAIIEMANASGLRLLRSDERDPLRAITFGTGQQIRQALDRGAKKIIVALGGSATVDGGMGILRALGVRFNTKNGDELFIPQQLVELDNIDVSTLDTRIADTEILVLCDVKNPLFGDDGAAAAFGAQKGAGPEDIVKLERALKQLSHVARQTTGKDMSLVNRGGAAGGCAAGLHVLLGAHLFDGINYFLDLTHFDASIQNCELIITGEGALDGQTLQGKAPFGVALRGKKYSVPVIALTGSVAREHYGSIKQFFDAVVTIGNGEMNLSDALISTEQNLQRVACELGNLIALDGGAGRISY